MANGCRCCLCETGLTGGTPDQGHHGTMSVADLRLLALAGEPELAEQIARQTVRLHVVTSGPDTGPELRPLAEHGYMCQCPDCLSPSARPRGRRARARSHQAPARQPWQPRPMSERHLRAA